MLAPASLLRSSKLSAVSLLGLTFAPLRQLVLRAPSALESTPRRHIHSVGPTYFSASVRNFTDKGTEDAKASDDSNKSNKSNESSEDPIHNFFAQYPDFDYDPSKDYAREFERLRRFKNWPTKGECKKHRKNPELTPEERAPIIEEYEEIRKAFATAQAKAFGRDFGTEVKDMGAWIKLCTAAGIDPVPESKGRCKSALRMSFVNLVDLHAYMRLPEKSKAQSQKPRRYRSINGLRNYTISKERYFPKEEAKEGGSLLKHLLKPILSRRLKRSDRPGHEGGTDVMVVSS